MEYVTEDGCVPSTDGCMVKRVVDDISIRLISGYVNADGVAVHKS